VTPINTLVPPAVVMFGRGERTTVGAVVSGTLTVNDPLASRTVLPARSATSPARTVTVYVPLSAKSQLPPGGTMV
jgi:hypothetical protein